jgi:predicted nucleic acid-binding protein
MAYKLLGFAVWNIAKLVARRKARNAASTRNLAIAGVVGVAIAGVLLAGSRNGSD